VTGESLGTGIPESGEVATAEPQTSFAGHLTLALAPL